MIGPILSGRDVVGETRPGRIQITGQIKSNSWVKETGAGGVGVRGGGSVMKIGRQVSGRTFSGHLDLTCENAGALRAQYIDTIRQIM